MTQETMTQAKYYAEMLNLTEYLRDVIHSDKTYECIINEFGSKCHLVPQHKMTISHIGTKTIEELANNTLTNLKKEIDELLNKVERLYNLSTEDGELYAKEIRHIEDKIIQKGYNGMDHVISFTGCLEECLGTYGKYTPEESGLSKDTRKYLSDIASYFWQIKSYIHIRQKV